MKKTIAILFVALIAMTMVFANAAAEQPAVEEVEEDVTLKALLYNISYDPLEMQEYKDIEALTGQKVEFSILPSENSTESLVLKIANKEPFDYIVNLGANTSWFHTLRTSGALLRLNDYIDKYAPQMWDYVSPEAWAGVSDDEGNVYALPYIYPLENEFTSTLTVRWDLVKAAGITELPKTLNEFYEFCKALKAFYGDQYLILTGPYNKGTPGNTMNIPLGIAAAFGIYNDWMLDDNGNVIYITEHPNFPAFIEYMNKLYNEGILDKEYAINTWQKSDEKMSAGLSIIEMHSRESINGMSKALFANFPNLTNDDLEFIPFLTDEEGNAKFMKGSSYWSLTVIPAYSEKNAAKVIKYAAEKCENEYYCLIGEEGVHFNFDENRMPIPIQPKFTDERNRSNTYLNMVKASEVGTIWSARLRKSDIMWKMFTTTTVNTKDVADDILTTAYFSYNNTTDYANYNPNLFSDLNSYLTQLVVGAKNISSVEAFMKDFKANGGEQVRTALQGWADRLYK